MLKIILKCVDVEEMEDKLWNKRCVGEFFDKIEQMCVLRVLPHALKG